MEFSHRDKAVASWKRTPWVKEVNISRVSWLLPPGSLSWQFITESLFLNSPEAYGRSYIWRVDALCNWRVTEDTPDAAIKDVSLLRFNSLRPDNSEWEKPVQKWVAGGWYIQEFGWVSNNVVAYASSEICERSDISSDIVIRTTTQNWATFIKWSNFIELAYRSNLPIIRLDVFLWGENIKQIPVTQKNEWAYKWSFIVPPTLSWSTTLTIRAVDAEYFSKEETKTINIVDRDTTPPEIVVSSPSEKTNTIWLNESIRFQWYIRLRWAVLWVGTHEVTVEAVDGWFNKASSTIAIEVLPLEIEELETEEEIIEEETGSWSTE